MADETVYLSVPITKSTEAEDGSIYVEGICTNDSLDLDNQIIDRDFARKGLDTWFREWGNVRQMHSGSLPPAGKACEMRDLGPQGIWIRTRVVEPSAKELVKAGVYQAYSVGVNRPRIAPDLMAKGGRVVDGIFSEISLVDFPANPTTKFMLAKRRYDSSTSEIDVVEKTVEPELIKNLGKGDSTSDEAPKTVEGEVDKAAEGAAPIEPEVEKKAPPKDVDNDGDSDDGSKTDSDDDGDGDGDAVDGKKATKSADAPYHLRRLHDGLCPVYSADAAAIAHPTLIRGIPENVGLDAFSEAVTKSLSPSEMRHLALRSNAFQLAMELTQADPKLLDEGMAIVRKSFAEYYPHETMSPDTMTPGKFDRGCLTDGRAAVTPQGHPRVPLGQDDTPHAGGHAVVKSEDADVEKGRTFYTNSAKEEVVSAMLAMHNYIAESHPDLCAIQPAGTDVGMPVPPRNELPTAGSPPAPIAVDEATMSQEYAGVSKSVTADVVKMADVEGMITKMLGDRTAELTKTIEALSTRLEELENAPNPLDAAIRSGALTATKQAKPEVDEGIDHSAEADSLVRLVKRAKHPDSSVSTPAYAQLMASYPVDTVAKLLSS